MSMHSDLMARIESARAQGMHPRSVLLGVEAHRKFMEWAKDVATVAMDGPPSLASLHGLPIYVCTWLAPNEWALEVR